MDPESNAPLCIHGMYHPYFLSDFSDIFLFDTSEFPFLDIYPGPCTDQPTILTTIPIFFHDFIIIIIAISIQNCKCFHIWICTLDPENSTPPPNTITNHPLFFSHFFLFTAISSFSIATLSIFGNVHWTLKTAPLPPTPSPTIPYFFLIFRYFIAIFHLVLLNFPYLEICNRP